MEAVHSHSLHLIHGSNDKHILNITQALYVHFQWSSPPCAGGHPYASHIIGEQVESRGGQVIC